MLRKICILFLVFTNTLTQAQTLSGLATYEGYGPGPGYSENQSLKLHSLATENGEKIEMRELLDLPIPISEFTIKPTLKNEISQVAWAQAKLFATRGAGIAQHLTLLSAYAYRPDYLNYAALNFAVTDLHPDVDYYIHFKIKNGWKTTQYRHLIKLPHSSTIDWISFKLDEFTSQGFFKSNLKLNAKSEIIEIGFSAEAKKIDAPNEVLLKISPNIEFDIVLTEQTKVSDFIRPRLVSSHAAVDFDKEEILKLFDRFFEEVNKIENQLVAKKTINQGFDAINAKFKLSGLTLDNFSYLGRVKSVELTEAVSLSEIMSMLNLGRLPIEAEPFASMHGRYSHQAQFIAGLHGMTSAEGQKFIEYLKGPFAGSVKMWHLWNVLFDSRAYNKYGIRYWKDVIASEAKSQLHIQQVSTVKKTKQSRINFCRRLFY